MTTPCNFKQIENGWWKCTNCKYVHRKPSSRAPVRLCGKPESRPPTVRRQRIKRNPGRKPKRVIPMAPKPKELGDVVHEALSFVGITPERVSAWLGRPCKCLERHEKFNNLSRWAKRVVKGKTEDAKKFLEELIR